MKMLPVMILAKYHSNARSAVSERPNLSARLILFSNVSIHSVSNQRYKLGCDQGL